MRTVILDANALMMPFQFRVDPEIEVERIFGNARIVVLSSIIGELERLAGKNHEAKAALTYARRFEVVNTDMKGDDSIVEAAKEMKAAVITNDSELRKRLRKEGVTVLYMREKSYLGVDGVV